MLQGEPTQEQHASWLTYLRNTMLQGEPSQEQHAAW